MDIKMNVVKTYKQYALVGIFALFIAFATLLIKLRLHDAHLFKNEGFTFVVNSSQSNNPKSAQAALSSLTASPSVAPPLQATSTPSPMPRLFPAQALNLTNWKLTLPIGSSEQPTEVLQPELATYKINPWFVALANGVRFLAPVNGVTTSGSNYPRSELREMKNNGTQNASWSSTTGTHTMFLDEAITAVPTTKKHVVVGQIHDASDDIIVIRLEYPTLYINVNGKNVYPLDTSYTLEKRFTIKFVVNGGQTKVYYNRNFAPAFTLGKSYSGAYFKAGAYTQSNCSKEGSYSLCNDNNYGEVVIYQVTVTHQ